MTTTGPARLARGRLVSWPRRVRDRVVATHGARARVVAVALAFDRGADEVTIRPWVHRLPRLLVVEIARARGYEPVGGPGALAQPGEVHTAMRFVRAAS